MSAVVAVVTVLAVLSTAIYWFFKYKFSYWKKRGVVYDEPSIPFGNLTDVGNSMDISKKIVDLYFKYKDQSPIGGLYFFTEPSAVPFDLDLIKNILIKDFSSFHDRGIYYNEKDDPLSGHLFLVSGQKWRSLRSKLSPTFTSGRMKFMYPTIVEVADKFTDLLLELVGNGGELEVKELLARFTTDVIGTCAFGIECNSLADPNAEFRTYGRKIFAEPRSSVTTRAIKSTYKNLARFLKLKNVPDDCAKFFMNVVKDTVQHRERNNIRRNDFMDLLIQLKNKGKLDNENEKFVGKMSVEELAAQAFVFFLAGFETSSTLMGYCLYELAVNQDIQEKLRKQNLDVIEKHNNLFTYEAMMEMEYLEQVINEALRKYPPVPILFRETTENYQVPNTEIVLEKGTRLFIPAYAIQHDPNIYPNPEDFDPERFSIQQTTARNSIAFLPFGDGPRNCIGLRFGRMQARIGLVALLRNFKFSLGKKTPVPLNIKFATGILTVPEGIHLKVEKI